MFLTFLQNTDLRDNLTYLKWYGMIGSTLIMVLIPAVVLIWSAFAMCMGIPEGNQRKKIVRIMIIIIAMFIICHVPKVSIQMSNWSEVHLEKNYYLLDPATFSGILKAKQILGRTFNSDKLGGIAFTKISKLTMCSA